MNPFTVVGSVYKFLQIVLRINVTESNGLVRTLTNWFYYYWVASGGGTAPVVGDKANLVTTAVTGFQAYVANPLIAILNIRAVPLDIQARWMDVVTDPFTVCSNGSLAAAGGIGAAADSEEVSNCVTVRKITGVRGKDFSRGRWHFAPIDQTYIDKDELNATGTTAFQGIRANLTGNIVGTNNTLVPVEIASQLCQLRKAPTEITGALISAYASPMKMVNKTIGNLRRRKERPTVVA